MVIQQAYKNIIDITLVAEPEVDLGSNRTGAHPLNMKTEALQRIFIFIFISHKNLKIQKPLIERSIPAIERSIPAIERFRREIDSGERDRFRRERFDPAREFRRLRRFHRRDLIIPTTLTSDEIWRRLQAQTNKTISLHERNKRRTQLSPMIMSNMIQSRGGNSNHNLPIAGNSNPLERGTQKSPLIMSNMIQTQDEISSTHDSPIAGSSNVFERGTKTHTETEWNSIQRVDEVSGIQHTRISDNLISPSSGLVSNKSLINVI
ncbi:hypothetical protein YC2023_049480 [Brassica napus]